MTPADHTPASADHTSASAGNASASADRAPDPADRVSVDADRPSAAEGDTTRDHTDTAPLTGKRRIAFVSLVKEGQLPGLETLLRSLALSNPGVCEDFVVLHPGLPTEALKPMRRLHPRLVERHGTEHADLLRISGYDTLISLSPGMLVCGDISPLLRLRTGVGAVVRQLTRTAATQPDPEGLLVIHREPTQHRDDRYEAAPGGEVQHETVPCRDAEHGSAQLRSTIDALAARPDRSLDASYDFLVSRLHGDTPVPETVRVLRFDVEHRPWVDSREGYEPVEELWASYGLSDSEFHARFCALRGFQHPELLAHFAPHVLAEDPTVDLAHKLGSVHLASGDYEAAVRVLTGVTAHANQPRFHETLGRALMAVSRYEEATTHFLLATADPEVAPRAFGRLAKLAWVLGELEASKRYAQQGLTAEPIHRECRAQARREPYQLDAGQAEPGLPDQQFAHVALYATGQENAGDKVLPEAVRRCLGGDPGPAHWYGVDVHRRFDEDALAEVNARRGLVVGGGGLFLPDAMPNGNSAWQWNIPDDLLRRIQVPLAVFAVGYNVFDGQSYGGERGERFVQSLRTLAERADFFGLRNRGSLERIRAQLPAELRERIVYQPCPTTVTRHLLPGWTDPATRTDTILLNCAYDRSGLRFGHDYAHFLDQIAFAVRALRQHADVRYAPHMPDDERLVHDLRRTHGITLPVEALYDRTNSEIHALFRTVKLVIGMRGHAGMIPFGCGTPILSLVSHPKMIYFLADIDRPEWGLSVHEPQLGAQLTERALAVLNDHAAAVADVHDRQRGLWEVTRANVQYLRTLMGS